jgi:hypothetical protein
MSGGEMQSKVQASEMTVLQRFLLHGTDRHGPGQTEHGEGIFVDRAIDEVTGKSIGVFHAFQIL